MITSLLLTVLCATAQAPKYEPVLNGEAEVICGIRSHPEQVLGLYAKRSTLAAYLGPGSRGSSDPWVRVGETRTKVSETNFEGRSCLVLESKATREILGNNPMEGQDQIRVKRRIIRSRKVWVAEDGSIVKASYEQFEPDQFSVEMTYGNGSITVIKRKGEKTETGQVEISVDANQFENEFLTMAWSGKLYKNTKNFAMLDPFFGGIRTVEAKYDSTFQALVGSDPAKGVRVLLKDSRGTTAAWVTDKGELLQLDLPNGERMLVEPKVGEVGMQKIRTGRG